MHRGGSKFAKIKTLSIFSIWTELQTASQGSARRSACPASAQDCGAEFSLNASEPWLANMCLLNEVGLHYLIPNDPFYRSDPTKLLKMYLFLTM